MSERRVRVFHPPLFILISLGAIISLAISASLVKYYNDNGYPNNTYRDRIKIILVAAIWTTFFGLYLLIGVFVNSAHILFGIASHLFSLLIAFLLFLIGTASLTALTNSHSCSDLNIARCDIVKGLVIIGWIETVFLFIALLAILGIGIKARSGVGIRRGTLIDA